MTGDGHPHESPGRSTSRSGDGLHRGGEPIGAGTSESDRTEGGTSAGVEPRRDVHELEARLDQRDADIQHVIDRYEAVLEDRHEEVHDSRRSITDPDGLVDTARSRIERVITDVRISLWQRR